MLRLSSFHTYIRVRVNRRPLPRSYARFRASLGVPWGGRQFIRDVIESWLPLQVHLPRLREL